MLGDKSFDFHVNLRSFCVYLGSKVTERVNGEREFSACFGRSTCLFHLLKKKAIVPLKQSREPQEASNVLIETAAQEQQRKAVLRAA